MFMIVLDINIQEELHMPTFRELVEKSTTNMAEEIGMLSGKGAQIAWDWFMKEFDDSKIYAEDAVPEDYLEKMSDKQIKTLYKLVKKYVGK